MWGRIKTAPLGSQRRVGDPQRLRGEESRYQKQGGNMDLDQVIAGLAIAATILIAALWEWVSDG